METKAVAWKGLTSNQLKIVALITMTCDHVGKELFPQYIILQIIGRLTFPIFAYAIAEGCRYTKNKKMYFAKIALLAFACQMVYFIAIKSLYQSVLITFSLSILLIYAVDYALKQKTIGAWLLAGSGLVLIYFITEFLPQMMYRTDFAIDYGIWGVLLPLFVYLGHTKILKLLLASIGLLLLGFAMGGIQWYSLGAILLLALYNGKRGKNNMKNLFYVYYPLHMVVIYAVSLIL